MLPMHRNSYDTFLISLYANGREHLIPDSVRTAIPSSTAAGFRQRDPQHYVGSGLWQMQQGMLDHHELMLRHARLKRLLAVITSVWVAFAEAGGHALLRKRHMREWAVDRVQQLSAVMPRAKTLELLGMTASSFSYALDRMRNKCGISPLELCRKRHPRQLSPKEVGTIRRLMDEPSMTCWTPLNIWHHARRTGQLLIGRGTFYRYLRLLGITRKAPRSREKRKGIVTTAPNEVIHVDTTFHTLPCGVRMAAVFVSDNFSRHILGHCASATHGFHNVREALTMAVQTMRQHHPALETTVMVTDGGGENTANGMAALLESIAPPHILQLIALRDIAFSNSAIEAVNRIFKRYLRHWQPQTPTEFIRCVERFIQDYAMVRPHGSLDGRTPFEAYTGMKAMPMSPALLAQARAERMKANTGAACGKCA